MLEHVFLNSNTAKLKRLKTREIVHKVQTPSFPSKSMLLQKPEPAIIKAKDRKIQ